MEKIYKEKIHIAGINNTRCLGTYAKVKVESYKFESDTHRRTSVWVDYFYDIDQFKRCWSHNSYMDAEKFYVRKGRSWVETSMASLYQYQESLTI